MEESERDEIRIPGRTRHNGITNTEYFQVDFRELTCESNGVHVPYVHVGQGEKRLASELKFVEPSSNYIDFA